MENQDERSFGASQFIYGNKSIGSGGYDRQEKNRRCGLKGTLRLNLKKSLYTIHIDEGKDIRKHMDDFNKIIFDLKNINIKIEEDHHDILLLSSLSKSY